MSKQHTTIPNEPEEMPARTEGPEITEPTDPKTREVPEEAPDEIPPKITPDTEKEGDNK